MNHRKSPRDYKLRNSILTQLYEFFRNREAVMLYLCETGDNRQEHRNRLFASWYRHATRNRRTFPRETGIILSVSLLQLKHHLYRFAKHTGYFQSQYGGRHILLRLDGIDGLATYAHGLGQLLLGHAQDGPFYS